MKKNSIFKISILIILIYNLIEIQAQNPELKINPHLGNINSVEISPNGEYFATETRLDEFFTNKIQFKISVWHTFTGVIKSEVYGANPVFYNDSVIVYNQKDSIFFWNFINNSIESIILNQQHPISDINAYENTLCIGHYEYSKCKKEFYRFTIWNIKAKQITKKFGNRECCYGSFYLSKNNKYLICEAGSDEFIEIWNVKKGKKQKKIYRLFYDTKLPFRKYLSKKDIIIKDGINYLNKGKKIIYPLKTGGIKKLDRNIYQKNKSIYSDRNLKLNGNLVASQNEEFAISWLPIEIWNIETEKKIKEIKTRKIETDYTFKIASINNHLIQVINNSYYIWDIKQLKLLNSFNFFSNETWDTNYPKGIKYIIQKKNGTNELIIGFNDGDVYVVNYLTNNIIHKVGLKREITSISYSDILNNLLICTVDSTLELWNLDNYELLYRIKKLKGKVISTDFSSDGNEFVVVSENPDYNLSIRKTKTGKIKHRVKINYIITERTFELIEELNKAKKSNYKKLKNQSPEYDWDYPDPSYITEKDIKGLRKLETKIFTTEKEIKHALSKISWTLELFFPLGIISKSPGLVKEAKYWKGNNYILLDGEINWRLSTNDFSKLKNKPQFYSNTPHEIEDDKNIQFRYKNKIYNWYSETNKIDSTILLPWLNEYLPILNISNHYFLNYENNLVMTDYQYNIKLIFILLDDKEWIIKTPDNYYSCSKNAHKYLGYTINNKLYTFSQFDHIYNRPDIVLEKIETHKKVTSSYYKAYLKRLDKLGFTDKQINSYNVPTIKIANYNKILRKYGNVTKKGELPVKIIAYDKNLNLSRINIWVNNVSVFGNKGLNIENTNSSRFESKFKLKLTPGYNNIEISCINKNFIESYKESIKIIYQPKTTKKPNLYIIGIGASHYKNIATLPNTDNDIREFIDSYKTKEGFLYQNVYIDTFINQNVLRKNIIAKKKWLQNTTENDIVIIYYSGHGKLDKNNDYYLYTYDTDTTDMSKNCIEYGELEYLLDSIPARRKLFLVNSCHSGEYDEDMKVFRLMKETFPELRRGTGAMTIASSYSDEFGLTGSKRFGNNSAFGFAIENILQNNTELSVNDFKIKLEEKVFKLSKQRQKPTFRNENLEMDFRIW